MERGQLSYREFQIVERIALGQAKKVVADKLHISIYTVETTVKNAYEKLGICRRLLFHNYNR